MFRTVLILIILTLPVSAAQTLHRTEGVSRDNQWVRVDNTPFQITSIVGGEHISHYHVLGFSGERYQLQFDSIEGDASPNFEFDGVTVESISDTAPYSATVLVEQDALFFSISYSAISYGEYRLTITKLNKG
jgi:hypothetical protein